MGGSKQTQTTNRQPWEPAQAGLKGVLEKANTLGNNMSIWTPQYSQDTQGGIDRLANLGTSPSFGGGTIRNVVGQTSGGMGTGYDTLMAAARGDNLTNSPYLDSVLGKSMQDAADKVNAQFSASGRYGSGAHTGVLSRELGGIETTARLGQYQQERQNQLNSAQLLGNLGLQGAGLSTQADQADANQAGLQLQAGQLRDAMGDATRMAPVNAVDWQAGLINPIAQQGGTETTVSKTKSNPMGMVLGGAMTGLGLMTGNPGLIGAGLGGGGGPSSLGVGQPFFGAFSSPPKSFGVMP